jgi:hypothetical protein
MLQDAPNWITGLGFGAGYLLIWCFMGLLRQWRARK